MRFRLLLCSMLFASTLLSAHAHAGPAEDRAAADALFREGRALVKAGKYADGCPKLEASQKLDPTVGTLLALGDCYELEGKTASAWATFNEAGSLARERNDERRGVEAKRRADLLESKLSKLTIEVAPENRVPGFEVRRNGRVLDQVLFGSAFPVDPGEQLIEAKAPGRQAWSTKANIEAKPGTMTVRIPELELVGAAKAVGAKADGQASLSYREGAPIPPGYRVESRKRTGLIVGGAAVFGTLWIASIAIAANALTSSLPEKRAMAWPFIIPALGPFISLGVTGIDQDPVGIAILLGDGLLQTGGLAMLVAGILAKEKRLVPIAESPPPFMVLPRRFGHDGIGLTFVGRM